MSVYGEGLAATPTGRRSSPSERRVDAAQARPLGARGRRTAQPLDAGADAGDQAPVADLGLRAHQVRPGADVPDVRPRLRHPDRRRCASSTSTAPRQALSNPYTGVLAIFASRLLNGRPPLIFEDGRQRRDFVHVRDVARACRLALERRRRRRARSSTSAAASAARSRRSRGRSPRRSAGRDLQPADHRQVPRRRHPPLLRRHRRCARALLGFEPQEDFEDGLRRAGRVARGRGRRSTASTRRPRSWRGGGWWHEQRCDRSARRRAAGR